MNASELRTLCTALGFTAVALQGGGKADAARAKAVALLIEEFCRTSGEDGAPGISNNITQNNEPAPNSAGQGAEPALWSCTPRDGHMVIEAQDKSGAKNAIAELRVKEGADSAAVATAIVTALNNGARKDALIAELTACLEMCLASDNLDWDTEQDCDVVLKRAKKTTNKI
jgi:hypothetical protein